MIENGNEQRKIHVWKVFVCIARYTETNMFSPVRLVLFQTCLQVSHEYTLTYRNIATYFFQLMHRWSTARKRMRERWPTYIIQTTALYTAIESTSPVVLSKFRRRKLSTPGYAFRPEHSSSLKSRRNKLSSLNRYRMSRYDRFRFRPKEKTRSLSVYGSMFNLVKRTREATKRNAWMDDKYTEIQKNNRHRDITEVHAWLENLKSVEMIST